MRTAGRRHTCTCAPQLHRIGKKQMHAGIDLAAYSGSKIHTTADGTVTKAWPSGAYGKLIEIRHAMGYRTRYVA